MIPRVVALLVLAGACARDPREAAMARTADTAAAAVAVSSSAFPARALEELAALRSGVTLEAWANGHPRDTLAFYSNRFDDWPDEGGCARATLRDTLRDSVLVIRHAYFGPPEPPADAALPNGPGAALARAGCALTGVWVESPPPHHRHLAVTADSVIALLTAKYGAGAKPGRERVFFGSYDWSPFVAWRDGQTTILAAHDRASQGDVVAIDRVLAIALLPSSGIGQRDPWSQPDVFHQELAARAAALAGAPPADAARLLRLTKHMPRDSAAPGPEPPRQIAATVREWLEAARERPPAQRAAALFAADLVLGGDRLRWSIPNDSGVRTMLTPFGARFVYSQLGTSWGYGGGLEDAAIALDSTGPVANLARLNRIKGGLDESGTCAAGAEQFRRVIAAGEPLLARLEVRDRARLHGLLGDAYADVVGLADGITRYAEAAQYAAEADGARTKAIEHYRRALALDGESADARATWAKAWRLLAGLPPRELRFFCVYD